MHVKIKLNKALRGNSKGSIIGIEVYDETSDYDEYIPKDIYWRRRFKDAEIDNCVEFVYPKDEILEITVEDDEDEYLDEGDEDEPVVER